jgi:hypothetical protein
MGAYHGEEINDVHDTPPAAHVTAAIRREYESPMGSGPDGRPEIKLYVLTTGCYLRLRRVPC